MVLDWKREETKLELLASYHFMREGKAVRDRASQFGRVVKAWDLKSHGVTRAGSNPAADVSFAIWDLRALSNDSRSLFFFFIRLLKINQTH